MVQGWKAWASKRGTGLSETCWLDKGWAGDNQLACTQILVEANGLLFILLHRAWSWQDASTFGVANTFFFHMALAAMHFPATRRCFNCRSLWLELFGIIWFLLYNAYMLTWVVWGDWWFIQPANRLGHTFAFCVDSTLNILKILKTV